MLLGLGAEAELVHVVDDLAEVVAAGILFLISPKISPILYSMVAGGGALLRSPAEVGEELLVDEVAQVVARERRVVVEVAGLSLGAAQAFPAEGWVEDVGVVLALKLGFGRRGLASRPSRYLRKRSQEVCSV